MWIKIVFFYLNTSLSGSKHWTWLKGPSYNNLKISSLPPTRLFSYFLKSQCSVSSPVADLSLVTRKIVIYICVFPIFPIRYVLYTCDITGKWWWTSPVCVSPPQFSLHAASRMMLLLLAISVSGLSNIYY